MFHLPTQIQLVGTATSLIQTNFLLKHILATVLSALVAPPVSRSYWRSVVDAMFSVVPLFC